MEKLPVAKITSDACVVSCPVCGYDSPVFQNSTSKHECNFCGAGFMFEFPQNQGAASQCSSEFAARADNMTALQLIVVRRALKRAVEGLQQAEATMGAPEPLSDYLGQSFSNIVDEIENLSCAFDSRISELQGHGPMMTINKLNKA